MPLYLTISLEEVEVTEEHVKQVHHGTISKIQNIENSIAQITQFLQLINWGTGER